MNPFFSKFLKQLIIMSRDGYYFLGLMRLFDKLPIYGITPGMIDISCKDVDVIRLARVDDLPLPEDFLRELEVEGVCSYVYISLRFGQVSSFVGANWETDEYQISWGDNWVLEFLTKHAAVMTDEFVQQGGVHKLREFVGAIMESPAELSTADVTPYKGKLNALTVTLRGDWGPNELPEYVKRLVRKLSPSGYGVGKGEVNFMVWL